MPTYEAKFLFHKYVDSSGKGLCTKVVVSPILLRPRSIEDSSLVSRVLAALLDSTDPSFNKLRGYLVPVSILRDSLSSDQVGSKLVEQAIDNCDGRKQV